MDMPIINMIERAGWIARIILMMLGTLSIISWAIIFNRLVYFNQMSKLNRRFREFFQGISNFDQIAKAEEELDESPFGKLGKLGLLEFKRVLSDAQAHSGVKDWSFYLQNQFSMVAERLNIATVECAYQLTYGLALLAIISSVAPFLGLLGTCWGIMNSFFEIGNQGSASLPVVAPGIAESLIVTIVGLAVAIPAVFFYNWFVHRADRMENEVEEFGNLLVLRLKREIFDLLYREKSSQ
jgi:biopolymer transport protein TolQ